MQYGQIVFSFLTLPNAEIQDKTSSFVSEQVKIYFKFRHNENKGIRYTNNISSGTSFVARLFSVRLVSPAKQSKTHVGFVFKKILINF